MSIYIQQIQLRNYRSCKKTLFSPQPDLSTLIGPNGSGKSNLLSGITLLNKIRHSPRHLYEEPIIPSVCRLYVSFNVNGKVLRFRSVIKYATNKRNIDEVLSANDTWHFGNFTGVDQWFGIPMALLGNFRYSKSVQQLSLFDVEPDALPLRYKALAEFVDEVPFEKIASPVEKVLDFVSRITYYSASQFTDPSKCPTFFEIEGDSVTRKDSSIRRLVRRPREEHTQFMYDLYLTYKNNVRRFQEYLSIVGKNGIGLIDGIRYQEVKAPSRQYEVYAGGKFVKKEVNNYLIIPTFVVQGIKLSPNQLSEGTFKTLAVVFYLVTDQSQLLLLEEPEVCVHHGLLASILQLIKDFSHEKQIIISTHSDYVLDGLDPSNVFLVKNESVKGTTISHVPHSMSVREYKALKEYLNSYGNLGEYWRHGDLEK